MQSQRKDHGDQMCAAPITLCAGKWVLGATRQCLTLHEGNLVIPGLPSCSCLCVKSLLSARRRQKGREPTWTAIMQAGGRQLAIVSIAWSLYCTSHLTPRHHQEQLWPQSWFQLSLRQHGARAGGKGGRGPGWQILILFAFQWQIMFYHFVPAFSFYKKAFPPPPLFFCWRSMIRLLGYSSLLVSLPPTRPEVAPHTLPPALATVLRLRSPDQTSYLSFFLHG